MSLSPMLVSRVFDATWRYLTRSPVGFDFNPRDAQILDTTAYRHQFEIGTCAPLFLYWATCPLLIAPRETNPTLPTPKFLITPSMLGSLAGSAKDASYGMSEAAVDYLALWIQTQWERFGAVVVVAHNPGMSKP